MAAASGAEAHGIPRFLTLEALRGLSAVAIMLGHLGGIWGALFHYCYLAVDLFFLMSGIVIAHAYETRLKNGWPLTRFAIARATRLAPLYFLGVVVGTICVLIGLRLGYAPYLPLALDLALALAFIPALWGTGFLYPLNAPGWSLFCEAVVNIAYASIAPKLTDGTLKVLIGLGFAALCLVIWKSTDGAHLGVDGATWMGGLARASFSFPLGVLIQRLHARGALVLWRVPVPILLLCVVVSFMVPFKNAFYDLAVIVLVYPILAALALYSEPKASGMVRFFTVAGRLSYPLYVLHYPLVTLTRAVFSPRTLLGAAVAPGCAIICIAIAYAADTYFDRPLQKWLKRKSRGLDVAAATHAPKVDAVR